MRFQKFLLTAVFIVFTAGTAFAAQRTASADILIRRALYGSSADSKASVQTQTSAPQQAQQVKPNVTMQSIASEAPDSTNSLMPEIYGIALSLVNESEREEVQKASEAFFADGFRDKAASVIGRAIGKECNFSLHRLGTFCLKTLPAAGDFDAQAEFIIGFMRGYSNTGLLMLSTEGLRQYSASNTDYTSQWLNVPENTASPAKNERIYVGKGIVFIPFVYGKSFKINCIANGKANVTMIKILPDFVNKRNWGAGVWEKEITVIAAPRAK